MTDGRDGPGTRARDFLFVAVALAGGTLLVFAAPAFNRAAADVRAYEERDHREKNALEKQGYVAYGTSAGLQTAREAYGYSLIFLLLSLGVTAAGVLPLAYRHLRLPGRQTSDFL